MQIESANSGWLLYLDTALYTYSATFAKASINRIRRLCKDQSPLLLGAFTIVAF